LLSRHRALRPRLFPPSPTRRSSDRQIVDMFSLQARQKGLEFRFDPPPHLPATVRADEKRLRQVLINLLSNAIRNTKHGGVTFRVDRKSTRLNSSHVKNSYAVCCSKN